MESTISAGTRPRQIPFEYPLLALHGSLREGGVGWAEGEVFMPIRRFAWSSYSVWRRQFYAAAIRPIRKTGGPKEEDEQAGEQVEPGCRTKKVLVIFGEKGGYAFFPVMA